MGPAACMAAGSLARNAAAQGRRLIYMRCVLPTTLPGSALDPSRVDAVRRGAGGRPNGDKRTLRIAAAAMGTRHWPTSPLLLLDTALPWRSLLLPLLLGLAALHRAALQRGARGRAADGCAARKHRCCCRRPCRPTPCIILFLARFLSASLQS